MKFLNFRNKKQFSLLETNELNNYVAKAIAYNSNIKPVIRLAAYRDLNKKMSLQKISKTLVVNRCVISLHKKRLNKVISVSRHLLLKFARQGLIYGLKKAVW